MATTPIKYPVILQEKQNKPGSVPQNRQNQPAFYLNAVGQKVSQEAAFQGYEKSIHEQNALVVKHEEAHRSAAGPQASGSPVYDVKADKDGRKVIFGGHQGISIPAPVTADASIPLIEKTKRAAQYVISGAEAPKSFDELSGADKQVAFRGRTILAQAENAKAKKATSPDTPGQRLNLII